MAKKPTLNLRYYNHEIDDDLPYVGQLKLDKKTGYIYDEDGDVVDEDNLYEGKIVQDRVNIERHRDSEVLPARVYERALAQDKMILGALKCAKLHGYTGEE